MQRCSRTQYMSGNTMFRTQRTRLKPLVNQQIPVANWWPNPESGAAGDEIFSPTNNSVKMTGFTGATSIVVTIPATIVVDNVTCYITSIADQGAWFFDSNYIRSFVNCTMSTTVSTTTVIPVNPGDYIAFAATAPDNPGSITISISNKFYKAQVIDTVTFTWN